MARRLEGHTLTAAGGERTTFSDKGQLVTRVDHNGNKTTYEYADNGLISTITDQEGHVAQFIDDANVADDPKHPRVDRMVDFVGRITTFTYDGKGMHGVADLSA